MYQNPSAKSSFLNLKAHGEMHLDGPPPWNARADFGPCGGPGSGHQPQSHPVKANRVDTSQRGCGARAGRHKSPLTRCLVTAHLVLFSPHEVKDEQLDFSDNYSGMTTENAYKTELLLLCLVH